MNPWIYLAFNREIRLLVFGWLKNPLSRVRNIKHFLLKSMKNLLQLKNMNFDCSQTLEVFLKDPLLIQMQTCN